MILRNISRTIAMLVFSLSAASACTKDAGSQLTTQEQKTAEISALDELIETTQTSIRSLSCELEALFPKSSHYYVFAGRSPTPLYALMARSPRAVSIPFSELKYSQILSLSHSANTTFFLKKALDHIHIYAEPLLNDMISKNKHASLVALDFTPTGISLGRFINLLEFYLKEQYVQNPQFKSWVDRHGFPSLKFLALAPGENEFEMKLIRANILDQKTPPLPASGESITTFVVKPGDVRGSVAQNLNTRTLIHHMMLQKLPLWTGTVLSLAKPHLKSLVYPLATQQFDQYAPYGSWSVTSSPLEQTRPGFSAEFERLRKALDQGKFASLRRCFCL